jgi:precorrin-6Y C5,15-methyltransferase (decarboxylating)
VVTLASVDRVRPVADLLTTLGYRAEGTQLQASRLAPLPGGSLRLAATNPVFVLWADRAASDRAAPDRAAPSRLAAGNPATDPPGAQS